MDTLNPGKALPPLDQIRQAEAGVTRRIAAAREEADHLLREARKRAEILIQQAAQMGQREGQAQYQEVIAKAQEEARAIQAQASLQARELRQRGNQRMEAAVGRAVNLLISLKKEGGEDEP